MEKILKNYNVSSLEELKELVLKNDEQVEDLIDFLEYFEDKQTEKYDN